MTPEQRKHFEYVRDEMHGDHVPDTTKMVAQPDADKATTAMLDAGRKWLAQQSNEQVAPCNMGDICLGCSPRNVDGSCPDEKPNMSCACYVVGFNDGMKKMDGMTPYDYTHLPVPTAQPKPLTENEIKHLWYEACQTNLEPASQLVVRLARAIEAAHGIKE